MSTVHERYRVTVQPGKNAEAAAARLARLVVQRWMPGNAGGGKSGEEAARLAGYTGTKHAVEVTASRLLKNAEVQAVIAATTERASTSRVLTAEQRRELLSEFAKPNPTQPIEIRDRIAALKELNAMDGLHLKKIEVTGPGGGPLQHLVAELPTDVIRKRLEELKARKP